MSRQLNFDDYSCRNESSRGMTRSASEKVRLVVLKRSTSIDIHVLPVAQR